MPDFLYTCGDDHDAGEAAHWPPFLAAAASYLNTTFGSSPAAWNATAAQLVTYLMGVVSHQIADINWHGLASAPAGYGFIEAGGGADYACQGRLASGMTCLAGSDDVPHTAADTGTW
jgi:hypothetical protein